MIHLLFKKPIGPDEVKLIREKVQAECFSLGLAAKNGFVLLFVVDELSCNIMEHSHASWMDLSIDLDSRKFTATLRDDGIPFDTGAEAIQAKAQALNGEGSERRLGLNLVGRLVDRISYTRSAGVNQVVLEKAWQTH